MDCLVVGELRGRQLLTLKLGSVAGPESFKSKPAYRLSRQLPASGISKTQVR